MVQTCFTKKDIPVTNVSQAAAMARWGVLSFDWATLSDEWAGDMPSDDDQKLLDAATYLKAAAPETKAWIYRSLVNPISTFGSVREKLEDPQYHGFFLKFAKNATDGQMGNYKRCYHSDYPIRNKTVCTELANRPSGNGDCGTVPCGWYLFDHRNESLRQWILNEWIMGPFGMQNTSVNGFLFDDWWSVRGGPAEANGWQNATGLQPNSKELKDIVAGFEKTQWAAQELIRNKGGFTWNNLNCDQNEYKNPAQEIPCGLFKTEGYFGSPQRRSNEDDARAQCSTWLRGVCTPNTTLNRIPLLYSFTLPSNDVQRNCTPPRYGVRCAWPWVAPTQDLAMFLLARGPYAWMGTGWLGCHAPWEIPRPPELELDYGEPSDAICRETIPGTSGVFVREWTKAHVQMDCGEWQGTVTMK
jgi:hypothetical protein